MYHLPQNPSTYDAMFSTGGYEGMYDLPYCHSQYYGLFKKVLREIRRATVRSILEVGCGTGGFAHMVFEKTRVGYFGFDFSAVAVERAIARTNRPSAFAVGDAYAASSYRHDYDAIVCTEVLEHAERDLDIIRNWRSGAFCICSVPDFDDPTHVRFFSSVQEVRDRYSSLVEIDHIVRVKRPPISNISLRSRLRALRWSRYQPVQVMRILGIGTIEQFGCWYLFVGRKY